jgi:DNA-binding LacI/PurR family transcriptional regulator
MATQSDIAQRLGVSTTTVSLALRGDPQISAETQSRVMAVAAEIGYIYRRRKRANSPRQIAYVAARGSMAANSFYAKVLQGAQQAALRYGMTFYFVVIEESLRRKSLLDDVRIDGMLLVGYIDEQTVLKYMALGLPMVLINNNLSGLGVDRVLIDNVHGVYRTVAYLKERGHRLIACMYGPLSHPSFRERLSGYRCAMQDFGLQPIEIAGASGIGSMASAEEHMRDYLSGRCELGFTALVTCTDWVAIGAIRALRAHGVAIPSDVSVVSFDDLVIARVMSPALTTNHVYREALGEMAVHVLHARMERADWPAMAIVTDTSFIERDSTQSNTAVG